MQIIVHTNGFFEWVDVPPDVDKTSDEFQVAIKAGKVKEIANGTWSMEVPKKTDTQVVIGMNEEDIIQCSIQEMTRGDRRHLNRVECVTRLLARHTLPHHAHATHVEEFQIANDDGPDEELFRKLVGEHVACHNINALDFDGLVEAYMTPVTEDDHHAHLHSHFNVKQEKLQAFRSKRVEQETMMMAARKHHATRLAAAAAAAAESTKKTEEVKP